MLNGSHVNAMAKFLKLFSISLVISKKQALFPTFIILSVLVRNKWNLSYFTSCHISQNIYQDH